MVAPYDSVGTEPLKSLIPGIPEETFGDQPQPEMIWGNRLVKNQKY